MSYTFGQEGGTTYGLVDWNDLFAPNTTIPWDNILQDLDTVICRIPYTVVNESGTFNLIAHRLFTNYKIYGYNHWLGDGVALCLNTDSSHSFISGEPCRVSPTASSSGSLNVRACFRKVSNTPSANDFGLGIVLKAVPNYDPLEETQMYTSVIVSGPVPAMKLDETGGVEYGEPIFYTLDGTSPNTYGVVQTLGNQAGQQGRILSTNRDLIINSSGDTRPGCVALLLNRGEIY